MALAGTEPDIPAIVHTGHKPAGGRGAERSVRPVVDYVDVATLGIQMDHAIRLTGKDVEIITARVEGAGELRIRAGSPVDTKTGPTASLEATHAVVGRVDTNDVGTATGEHPVIVPVEGRTV